MEIQHRHRQSWRASDGWSWARQTGTDPGEFIFAPNKDWEKIRQATPDVTGVEKVVRLALSQVPTSEVEFVEFSYVSDLLGDETLPAGALPKEYREALIELLLKNKGVSLARDVPDPLHRDATRILFKVTTNQSRSIYLGNHLQYLASVSKDTKTEESGSRVVVARREVGSIPESLLNILGSARAEQAIWH